ncbi:MAG: threonylcarbamoyl-AMP synthase [Alphaproteobacteria bacterium]|nr:threonylcarbamoyl-AMP synthase [Alphaproteobacteria bacterium]MBL7098581.1 threonylcarbamoyl-AMP synthase [Alphaproteobacteria bacterium]
MDSRAAPKLRRADDDAVAEAARLLCDGKLVAFPTETVYGLGADATNGRAVARIFEAKSRPRFNPLIVHVRDMAEADTHAVFNANARTLARGFWPGPLTLVLPRRRDCRLSELVSAGLDTVALRVPSHPVAQKLIAAAARPLAAPSANASGKITATTAAHVAQGLGDKVDLILDGGATRFGLESTVIGFDGGQPLLLRAGAIPREPIEAAIGKLARPVNSKVQSPGQLSSHYAPRGTLRLDAKEARPGETLLGYGPKAPASALNLSRKGSLREAAANLFAMLHALNDKPAIAVMPIPDQGLGEAINDRLRRAAAPRDQP